MPQGRVYKHTFCLSTNLAQSISQIPNFPKDPSPDGPARFGKLGNWEMAGGTDFPISQRISAHLAQHDLGNWEIGKCLQVRTSQFPNFPKDTSPDGPARFGKLGNWEMLTGTDFQISQFPKRSQPIWLSTIWEIGKLGNGYRYILPNFPISQKTQAQMGQHDLGNWEMLTGTYFPISQKISAHLAQHDLGNWEIRKWLQVHTSQFPNFPKDTSPDGPARFGKLGNWEA